MANMVFNSFKRDLMNGAIDLDTSPVYMMLVTSSYTPDQDAHTKRSDVTGEVANGNGYTTGGSEVANKAVSVDNTTNRGKFTHDAVAWANSTITARGAVYFVRVGADLSTPADDPLIGYVDFVTDKSSSSGTFTVTPHADGALYLG